MLMHDERSRSGPFLVDINRDRILIKELDCAASGLFAPSFRNSEDAEHISTVSGETTVICREHVCLVLRSTRIRSILRFSY